MWFGRRVAIIKIHENRDIFSDVCARPLESRGRLYDEVDSVTRSAFQRDRDRIIHCSAFRRLKYKTQVFVYHEGDNYRTRLSHSLEVAQIARSISRFLGLNEDLTETLALAHDLGHTCFGHAGEEALQACMLEYNGFDHNAQALRIVTKLEQRYPSFDGLNLSWETLEGLVKHNGPLAQDSSLPAAILEYNEQHNLELNSYPSAEAQVAAVSDDIAYNAHDIDDGLNAGLLCLDDLKEINLVGPIVIEVEELFPKIDKSRQIHEIVRRLINSMVNDVIGEAAMRYNKLQVTDSQSVRNCNTTIISFSSSMIECDKALKSFLFPNMYRHPRVIKTTDKAQTIVKGLFSHFYLFPDQLPEAWQRDIDKAGGAKVARRVADYIAGMTDRFALDEHNRIFGLGLAL